MLEHEEINLSEDEGCIVFDFGCYLLSNPEILHFSFNLGEEIKDFKINHRYPNKLYQTISRKYKSGRVSRIGYPYILKLKEQDAPLLLHLEVGLKNVGTITMVFPIKTNLTKNKPICGLSLRYNFETLEFEFTTMQKTEHQITRRCWCNNSALANDYTINLHTPKRLKKSLYVYRNVITPFESSFSEFFMI